MSQSRTTRRKLLASVAVGGSTVVTGSFGIAHAFPPEQGTIHIYDHDWPGEHTLRLQLTLGDSTVHESTYAIPTEDPALEVPPATYQITVFINGEQVAARTWDVTSCASQLYVMLYEEPGAVRIQTSAC